MTDIDGRSQTASTGPGESVRLSDHMASDFAVTLRDYSIAAHSIPSTRINIGLPG